MSSTTYLDRSIEAYYADVRDIELLSADTEQALFRAYRTCEQCAHSFEVGAPQATCPSCGKRRNFKPRDKLIEGALRFVVKVARDYSRRARGFNHEAELLKSLISAGNLGLIIAADRFDADRGTRFLTYAAWWIREKILEELDNMGVVRMPAYRQKAIRARRKAGDQNIPDDASIVLEDVSEIDTKHKDERLERDLVNTYGSDLIQQALVELGFRARDKYIIMTYFGVREEPKNLRQISNRLDLSSERVRQIKKDALDRLRGYLEAKMILEAADVLVE